MRGTGSSKFQLVYRAFCLSLIGLLAVAQGHAVAGEPDDSDALITRGLALRQKGEDQEALPLFQQAAEKKKTPRAVAQVGLCEFALGLWVDAEGHVEQALASRTDPWIRKNERSLTAALEKLQEKLGSLDVWGEPNGARVLVDGRTVGTLPLKRLRVPEGRHSLAVESAGFLTDTRVVQISARAVAREHASLAPVAVVTEAPATALATPTPTPPAIAPVTNGTAPASVAQTDADASAPIYKTWWFWTGIGVVAVAAGATAFLVTRKDHCQSSGGGSCVAW
jgi:hypothetical protein